MNTSNADFTVGDSVADVTTHIVRVGHDVSADVFPSMTFARSSEKENWDFDGSQRHFQSSSTALSTELGNSYGSFQLVSSTLTLHTVPAASRLISTSASQIIERVIQVGILPVVVLCGVIMNIINMVVFWRIGLSDRVNICLFSLALSDSGYMVLLLGSRVYSVLSLADPVLGQYWKARSLVLVGAYAAFLNTSTILTLLVSLDRCCCVVRPLQAKTLLSARHTCFVVIFVFTLCLCCCGLACFKYDIVTYVDPVTNSTQYRSTLTPFYRRHRDVIDAIFQYTFNITVPTLSLFCVMVATSVITVRMRQTSTWRRKATQTVTSSGSSILAKNRELATTRMLVVVCVTFTLCTIPAVTLSFVRNLVPGFLPSGRYNNTFFVSNTIMHLLSCFNSSSTFIIYYVMGSRFRATLSRLIKGRKKPIEGKASVANGTYMSSDKMGSTVTISVSVVSETTLNT